MNKYMNFGDILVALKAGKKVAREGWNGNKIKVISDYPKYIPVGRIELREDLGLVYIKLSNGDIAVCDEKHYDTIKQQEKWSISKGYPYFTDYKDGKKTITLHSLIIKDVPEDMMIDHINGNKLDNRDENLRIVTSQQNNSNRSGKTGTSVYKGVSFDSSRNKWISSIQINSKTIHIGRFDDEIQAAKAYDKESFNRYGEYAKVNFPEEINKPSMFLFLVPGSTFKVNRPPLLGIYPEGTNINYCPHIDMKTADNRIVPWLASQTDVLAEDWVILE